MRPASFQAMSEDHAGGPTGRLFRAAIPGRLSGTAAREDVPIVLAPGRGWLELAVLLAAAGIVIPLCGVLAVPVVLKARRAGSPRWLAALLAAVWCSLL